MPPSVPQPASAASASAAVAAAKERIGVRIAVSCMSCGDDRTAPCPQSSRRLRRQTAKKAASLMRQCTRSSVSTSRKSDSRFDLAMVYSVSQMVGISTSAK